MLVKVSNAAVMALAGILLWVAMPFSVSASICGDINNDGTGPDISDLVYLVDYGLLSGPPPSDFFAADLNGDGNPFPDISDVIYLIDYAFVGGPAPVCPISIDSVTTVIPRDSSAVIQAYDTSTGILTLDASSQYAQQLAAGTILIGQNDSTAPFGFLRKVTSFSTQGSSVVLQTQQATMLEAFEDMDITDTVALNPSKVRSVELFNGAAFLPNKDGKTFDLDLGCVLYDQDGDPETTNDQIRLDGNYSFSADLFAKVKISFFSLKEFEAGIQTDENAVVGLSARLHWDFGDELEIKLAELHLGAIPIGGAVWMTPTLVVKAYIHGDLTITFETSVAYSQQLRYGIGYANNSFYTISEGDKDFTYTPPQFTAEFDFEPGVSLGMSCLIYGVAGPYMSGKAGFHFQALFGADPCMFDLSFNLNAILYAVVGIQCDILGLDYSQQYQIYTYPIGNWDFPLSATGTIEIDAEPDSIDAPWSLTGPCSYSSSGSGDTTLTGLNPGDYTLSWGNHPDWVAPADSLKPLGADDTITFAGTYAPIGGPDSLGTVTDVDGNVYQTVKIGDQWWMAENLKVTHYRNGDPITDRTAWGETFSGKYCSYNNDANNAATYGLLYNNYAVNDGRHIAPQGWHIPSDVEWKELEMELGMSHLSADSDACRGNDEGGKLKSTGTILWSSPNVGATNESGFTALPGGNRDLTDSFSGIGTVAYFWTSSGIWYRDLTSSSSNVCRPINGGSRCGFSVRCVRDEGTGSVVIDTYPDFSLTCHGHYRDQAVTIKLEQGTQY